jgi:hypothetical protein
MNHRLIQDGSSAYKAAPQRSRQTNRDWDGPVMCRDAQLLALAQEDRSVAGVAQVSRRSHQCVQDGLQVECRATDYLEYVGGCGLLLTGLNQFAGKSSNICLLAGKTATGCGLRRIPALQCFVALRFYWFIAPAHWLSRGPGQVKLAYWSDSAAI